MKKQRSAISGQQSATNTILSLSLEIPIRIPLAKKDKAVLLAHLTKEAQLWTAKCLKEKGDYCGWAVVG